MPLLLHLITMAAMPLSTDCFEAKRDIPAETVIAREDLAPASCRDTGEPRLIAYSREARAAIARDAISAGTYLGPVLAAPDGAISKGAVLTLRARIGAVTIERKVTAMQSASPGDRLFVRDEDGHVFALPYALGPRR